jgi:hypothetical protein
VKSQSLHEPKDDTGWLKPLGGDEYAIHRVYELGEDGYGRQELKARSGMKVAAVVDDWPRSEMSPRGHIVDVLGEPGENDTEMHAILAEYALPYRFESDVANAADRISEDITAEDVYAIFGMYDVGYFEKLKIKLDNWHNLGSVIEEYIRNDVWGCYQDNEYITMDDYETEVEFDSPAEREHFEGAEDDKHTVVIEDCEPKVDFYAESEDTE